MAPPLLLCRLPPGPCSQDTSSWWPDIPPQPGPARLRGCSQSPSPPVSQAPRTLAGLRGFRGGLSVSHTTLICIHTHARTQHSQTHKPHVCTHAALTNTPHVCTHAAHTNTQITCMHARSTHVNAHTCTHRTHVHTHSTHTGTRSATHPCTHSTHMQPHEALCLTPAGARGGRLQCRASAPRCPWTLRGFSAQGRTPEALARGCLKASRPAALLMAGGEKRLGPEGQTEQNHSDSLGAARAPRGSNTTGFCRARPGLNPTVKWPSLPASQTVARGGLWAAASVGPLAVSWASGSSQRPCSPGRPSLHQLTSKPR